MVLFNMNFITTELGFDTIERGDEFNTVVLDLLYI